MTLEEIKRLISKLGHTYKDGSSVSPGYTYHPIPFPEFADIPYHKDQCIKEWEVIKENYDFKGKTVLEIGSSVGYFTFKMLEAGAESVTAFEADIDAYNVARAVAEYKGLVDRVRFNHASFNVLFASQLYNHDCCFFLNSHMWLTKQIGFLESMKCINFIAWHCNIMFFQTAHRESAGMYKVEELKNLRDIKTFIRLSSDRYKSIDYLSENIHDNKPRYLFKCSA